MDTKKIKVTTGLNENGAVVPKQIIWDDYRGGRRFDVTKVLSVTASYTGEFNGLRYTVMIGNAKRNLYRYGSEWYVEIANKQK